MRPSLYLQLVMRNACFLMPFAGRSVPEEGGCLEGLPGCYHPVRHLLRPRRCHVWGKPGVRRPIRIQWLAALT